MGHTGGIPTGVFGGSFNPLHNGHIALAKTFADALDLEEVWLMVSPQNPLKKPEALASDRERLAMARPAEKADNRIKVSDYEFSLPRPSYTWNTMQALEHSFPGRSFALLIGADNWAAMGSWHLADKLLARYRFAIYPRPGYEVDTAALPPGATLIEAPEIDISSTEIRRRIATGESAAGMMPPETEEAARRCYLGQCDAVPAKQPKTL